MSRHVLLVDDDDLVREVAQMSLELVAGWTVTTASSGVEALEVAREDPPDAILLDVMMPVLDGPETMRRMREVPALAGVPVVFLTAKAMDQEMAGLRDLDASGVITKPFDPMRLHEHVAEALGW